MKTNDGDNRREFPVVKYPRNAINLLKPKGTNSIVYASIYGFICICLTLVNKQANTHICTH